MSHRNKSQYYQTAARYLFERRGAPFFLSPAEFAVLSKWASMGIPLRIVLEGIRNAFDGIRKKSFQRKKIFRLIHCEHDVMEAFKLYKDRKIGESDNFLHKDESIINLKSEVNRFIEQSPREIFKLKKIFLRAQEILSQRNIDEELLEKADAEVEQILLTYGSDNEKERILERIKVEHREKKEMEIKEIFRIKWIKQLRKKYKIPYLSVFYY